MRCGGQPRHRFWELRQTGNHSVRKSGIVLLALAVDPDPPDAQRGRRLDVVVVALRDVNPRICRASEHRLEALEMRMVWLVGGDVLGRDDGVKRLRQPALGERDEVAIAVGQQGQLPTSGKTGQWGMVDVSAVASSCLRSSLSDAAARRSVSASTTR